MKPLLCLLFASLAPGEDRWLVEWRQAACDPNSTHAVLTFPGSKVSCPSMMVNRHEIFAARADAISFIKRGLPSGDINISAQYSGFLNHYPTDTLNGEPARKEFIGLSRIVHTPVNVKQSKKEVVEQTTKTVDVWEVEP